MVHSVKRSKYDIPSLDLAVQGELAANNEPTTRSSPVLRSVAALRSSRKNTTASVLGSIYEQEVNIAIWERPLPASLSEVVDQLLKAKPSLQFAITLNPSRAREILLGEFGSARYALLADDIAQLIDMFCCLFELKRAGLRLRVLDKAMCPRFHVDRVPCRLVSTYTGTATEWLEHQDVNRHYLSKGAMGLSDEVSGLYDDTGSIQRLHPGDVALLKGESWEGNENCGLVHRSPMLSGREQRLLLTLDFSD